MRKNYSAARKLGVLSILPDSLFNAR